MDLFELQASLTLDTGDFEDALSGASSVVQSFANSMESGVSGAVSGLESNMHSAAGGVLDFVEAEKDASSETSGLASVFGNLSGGVKGAASAVAMGFSAMASGALVAVEAISKVASAASAAVNETAAYLDNVDKASQRIGISAQAYQEWSFILEHSGASINTMQMSMKTLVNAADSGNAAFAKLGITVTDTNGVMKSQEQLFSETITALQNMGDSAERTALANDLLGRGAMEFGALLNTSAEDTQAMRDELERLGGVMSDDAVKAGAEFEDMLLNMQTGFTGLKRSLIAEFLPGISQVMKGISDIFAGDNAEGILNIKEGVSNAIQKVAELVPQAAEVGVQILVGLGNGILSAIPIIVNGMPAVAESIYQAVISHKDVIASAGPQILSALASAIVAAIPVVIEVINTLGAAIFQTVISFAGGLLSAGASLISSLGKGISGAVGNAVGAVRNIGSQIVAAARSFVSGMKTIGVQIVQGLIGGIKAKAREVANAAREVVQDAINAAKSALGIASPSKVFRKIGSWTMEGFENGMLSRAKRSIEVAQSIARNVARAYSNEVAELQRQFDAIEAEQERRDAEKKARERAEKLAELEARVASAVGDEWQKAHDELEKQKAEWAEEDLRAQEEADKKALQSRIDTINSMKDAYEDALEDIEDSYSDSLKAIETDEKRMSDKMSDYGDLFHWESKRNGDVLKLDNLDTSIQNLTKYGDILNALQNRGIAESLMDEILGMSIDNAIAYGQKLLDMGSGTFQSYMAQYLEKQAIAENISSAWYSGAKAELAQTNANQIAAANERYAQQLAEFTGNAVETGMMAAMERFVAKMPQAVIQIDGQQLAKALWSPLNKQSKIIGRSMA